MNDTLMESLLNDNEGSALDFKEGQYKFENATDDDKSELLKDILAFANAWRQTSAHIVIGVREVKGARHLPVGITDHIDDAKLQQFVNSKTNRHVHFSYEPVSFEGKQIGVITIPKQTRPVFLTKAYGKLKKQVVYYRQGSSTAEASPDEIVRMGAGDLAELSDTPTLELHFADLDDRKLLGPTIAITTIFHAPHGPMPDYDPSNDSFVSIGSNRNFYREMAGHLELTRKLCRASLAIKNLSGTLVKDVRVEIGLPTDNTFLVIDHGEYPQAPLSSIMPRGLGDLNFNNNIDVERYGSGSILKATFDKIQPHATGWSSACFYVISLEPKTVDLEATIYADNLKKPQVSKLSISTNVEKKSALTFDEIMNVLDEGEEDEQ